MPTHTLAKSVSLTCVDFPSHFFDGTTFAIALSDVASSCPCIPLCLLIDMKPMIVGFCLF